VSEVAVKELNALLKGELMAVDAYERFIQEVEDEKVRQEFRNFQEDHMRHADELAARIRALGGKPDYSTGFAGFMAGLKAMMEGIGGMDDIDILKKAYDGEDKGIAKAEEIVRGDLDEGSKNLVNDILSTDHEHLKTMASMIAEFKIKH